MSLLTDVFGKRGNKDSAPSQPVPGGNVQNTSAPVLSFFQALSGYTPAFTTFDGGLYEAELTRAAIHSYAKACSKLSATVCGAAAEYESILNRRPNEYESASQFIYRLATCLAVNNTAFIVPIFSPEDRETIIGLYPAVPETCVVKADESGEPWLEYAFGSGQRAAVRLSRVGILRRHYYKSDIFGETNKPILETLKLLHTQAEAIDNGVKQSATIRFIAKLASALQPESVAKERERFIDSNLSSSNTSGVMMVDAKYEDIKQIESRPFIIDPMQMELINNNVYSYFGVNKAILQNSWESAEAWDAFYKGEVEPFALQLSEAVSRILIPDGGPEDSISYSMNRLQYASVSERLTVVTQMFDREMMTINEARTIFALPPVEDGDKRYRRGEYKAEGVDEDGAKEESGPPSLIDPKDEPKDDKENKEE